MSNEQPDLHAVRAEALLDLQQLSRRSTLRLRGAAENIEGLSPDQRQELIDLAERIERLPDEFLDSFLDSKEDER